MTNSTATRPALIVTSAGLFVGCPSVPDITIDQLRRAARTSPGALTEAARAGEVRTVPAHLHEQLSGDRDVRWRSSAHRVLWEAAELFDLSVALPAAPRTDLAEEVDHALQAVRDRLSTMAHKLEIALLPPVDDHTRTLLARAQQVLGEGSGRLTVR